MALLLAIKSKIKKKIIPTIRTMGLVLTFLALAAYLKVLIVSYESSF
jgi:hypothetical protein